MRPSRGRNDVYSGAVAPEDGFRCRIAPAHAEDPSDRAKSRGAARTARVTPFHVWSPPREDPVIEAKEKALAAVSAAQEKKGQNLTVIDLEGQCSYTDYLVIISATSERQTSGIAESIVQGLQQSHGLRPIYREGHGGWIVLDYGDVIVHVFIDDARAYYDLDRLWSEAPRIQVPAPQQAAVNDD